MISNDSSSFLDRQTWTSLKHLASEDHHPRGKQTWQQRIAMFFAVQWEQRADLIDTGNTLQLRSR